MIRVLKETITFFILTLLLLTALFMGVRYWHLKSKWKLDPSISTVFVGDSHIEQSINDKLAKGIRTFAQSGDCYLYTYCKVTKLIKDNPHIKNVFISVDYHNVDITAEEWYSYTGYLDFKVPQTFALFGQSEYRTLLHFNPWGFIKCLPKTLSISDRLKEDKTYIDRIGAYQPSSVKLSMDSINIYRKSKYLLKASDIQLIYLKRLIKFCKARGKNVFLLTSPVHSSVRRIAELDKIIERIAIHAQVNHLNYRDFKLKDEHYSDIFHLNQDGAKVFTNYLMTNLELN